MSQTFDPSALDELFELEGDSPGLVQTLIDDYVQLSQRLLNEIQTSAVAVNYSALDMSSHSLKSSSQVLGFLNLAEVCLKIEAAARDKTDLAPLRNELDALPRLRQEAIAAAQAFLKTRPGVKPK